MKSWKFSKYFSTGDRAIGVEMDGNDNSEHMLKFLHYRCASSCTVSRIAEQTLLFLNNAQWSKHVVVYGSIHIIVLSASLYVWRTRLSQSEILL